MLHGWGHNGELWKSLAEKFGKNAVSFDMPGFGNEPLVSSNWGVPEYASWVTKKINKQKNVILIGHSFGGRVAAEIASKNPKWLKALVLSGAPCIYRPSLYIKFKIKLYKLFKILVPKNFRKLFYTGELKRAGKLEKIFRKVVNYDQTEQLKKINSPTLLIWGENDKDVPLRIAKEINQLIKNSELKIIENAGHNSYKTHPNKFMRLAKRFLSNL